MELNHPYSMKEVAEFNGVSYNVFRNKRKQYEEHMELFFDYTVEKKGRSYCYIFTNQKEEFIRYRDFYSQVRTKAIQTQIKKTISQDPRQTGANVARIIIVDGEIQALGLVLSTLTRYTQVELKKLVENQYYIKEDYRWCILNAETNAYELLSQSKIEELRSYFKIERDTNLYNEENILAQQQDGSLTKEEAAMKLGNLRMGAMISGMKRFQEKYNAWPMKVPVYVRNALIEEEK